MKMIYASDIHLRYDKPICRKDENWIDTQLDQLLFVRGLLEKYKCPFVIGGDLFHSSQVPAQIVNHFISCFVGYDVYSIAGQHDMMYHSMKNSHRTSYGILWQSGIIKDPPFSFANYGEEILPVNDNKILMIHDLIFEDEKKIPPNVRAKTAQQVLNQNRDYDWILCGDQHHGFHYESKGRHVIMGGCFNRQASDFIDYEPVVWFIDTEKNIVEPIKVPDDVNMVSNEHIQIKKDREDRISAFVTLVGGKKAVTLDFEENVKQGAKAVQLSPRATDWVENLMEAQ
jgi:hypothetical protein